MSYTSTMTVSLPKDLEAFIQQKVQAGEFRDASDVVCEAVRQLSQQGRDWNTDSPELKAFLLEAVRGKHRPVKTEELEAMEQRVLAEEKARCR